MRALFIFVLFCLWGCKDGRLYKNCCGGLEQQVNVWVWTPNAYTPDGDGLNDAFRVVPKELAEDSIAIQKAWNFEARDHKGNLIYEQDTVYSQGAWAWDFMDKDGELRLGTLEVTFLVLDQQDVAHAIRYEICVFTCMELDDLNVDIDFAKCRFEDMIDLRQGYVNATHEVICP